MHAKTDTHENSIVTLPSDTEIAVTRFFAAPPERVFDAWTQPDLVRRWLLGPPGWTMPVCEIDLRAGGEYRFVWRSADGASEFGMGGTFEQIERPAGYSAVERYCGGEAFVSNRFNPLVDGTESVQTMRYGSREERDAALASGMTGGIEQSYVRLDASSRPQPPNFAMRAALVVALLLPVSLVPCRSVGIVAFGHGHHRSAVAEFRRARAAGLDDRASLYGDAERGGGDRAIARSRS